MGVTISHVLGIEAQYVKDNLDRVEAFARDIIQPEAEKFGIPFNIWRQHENRLLIDIGGCETLNLDFRTPRAWREDSRSYAAQKIDQLAAFDTDPSDPHYKWYPEQLLMWSAAFCKTQYGSNIVEHQWVAELIRCAASRCKIAHVYDEGDYYHSGKIEDAAEAIGSTAKVIESTFGMLQGAGWKKDQITKGGETKIQPFRTRPNEGKNV